MNNLVSIIMPSYNTADYIAESIDSVVAQTYINWELIIVDDCSTDNTDDVVRNYLNDKRINYCKNERNSGAAVSRNRALKLSRGKWIAFLDSDDLWHPRKLELQIKFMEKKGYYFSYTNYCQIDQNSQKTGVWVTGPKRVTKIGMYCYCWPGCLTVMYNRDKVGLIQINDIKKNNDYAMWLKVVQKADCYLFDRCLSKYRIRKGSISRQSYVSLIKWHYFLFRKAENMGAFFSAFWTCINMFFGIYKKKVYVKQK